MAVKTINTELLQKMFLAGAANLEAKKEFINELNVFPVPDGDTGTNMSMTIISAAKEVAAVEKPVMKDLAKAISSGSLRGARGNSGVILSQLLRGFTKTIKQAAMNSHVRLRQVEFRTQAPDHPILWAADESYYLKFYIFQVIKER